jgi:hypothetical protein
MRLLLNRRIAAWSLGVCFLTSISANAGLLPERVEKAAQERMVAGTYQTLVFGVVDGDKSEVVAFGKLDDGRVPDGNTVYEIDSVTKTFMGTLLARAMLLGRVTLNTAVFDVAVKNDHLDAQLTGQPAFPIFASAKDKFFYKIVDAQLDFERDTGGKVVAVVLHQNGRDMRAPRITTQR